MREGRIGFITNKPLSIGEQQVKIDEIKGIAKHHNLKIAKANKSELIRAIQQAEGNSSCFNSNSSQDCGQQSCLWRQDCV